MPDITLSTKKLAGGSVQTVVRRVKQITVSLPDGQPPSVYIEQEDVTRVDGERISAQSVEQVALGHLDVADDDHLEAMQDVAAKLDERVAANDVNRSAQEKRLAEAQAAEAARIADAEEIVIDP